MVPLVARPFDAADTHFDSRAANAHGITLTLDGRTVAFGGLVKVGPHWWTFAHIEPEARQAITLHRMALRGLAGADAAGIDVIYGYCDETKPRALDWIERIGFRLAREDEKDEAVRTVERWCGRPAWIRYRGTRWASRQ